MDATVRDPRPTGAREVRGWVARMLPLLRDERDGIFARTIVEITAVVVPLALGMFLLPGAWPLLFAVPYLLLVYKGFAGRYILMVHALCHRPLAKKRHRWLETYVTWGLGPFFGMTPTSFYVHHMGMHHPENNLEDDLSSTLGYQRDRFDHFLHYWARFFFTGHVHLVRYLRSRRRHKLVSRFLKGEIAWTVAVIALLVVDPISTLVVLVAPVLVTRFVMMCGNWAQHAFVDVNDAANPYRNSTCLTNTAYNHRCYNDGYHIVHHIKPALHWSEMAEWYERRVDEFARQGAVVFDGVPDNQAIFWRLMRKDYGWLAERVVRFDGDARTDAEVADWLRERVQRSRGPRKPLLRTPEQRA